MRTLVLPLVIGLLTVLPTAAFADGSPEVSLEFKDADVVTVLQSLAELGKKNVIVHPDVKGTISVSLHDTPWEQALQQVAQTCGCRVKKQPHGIWFVEPDPGMAEEQARRRALEERQKQLELELVALERMKAEKKRKAEQASLRFYDVRDLRKKKVETFLTGHDARRWGIEDVKKKDDVLIVRATDQGHEKFQKHLTVLRTTGHVKGEWDLRAIKRKKEIEALQQKAARLEKAAALLREAGDLEGARRARLRMEDLRAKVDAYKADLAAQAAQRKQAAQAAPKHLHVTTVRTHGVEEALQALRTEVGALRGEVRALTEMVRELVTRQTGRARR